MHDPNTICVVIPAFNAAAFLAETVASVLAARDVTVHVVIVDDGSRDDTAAVARKLEAEHDNVVLISQQNGGVSSARNAGINAASRYICFLDADDLLAPDGLRHLLLALQAQRGAVAAYGRVGYLTSTGQRKLTHGSQARQSGDISTSVLCGNLIDTPGAVLFCTKAILRVGGFLPGLRIGEDWNLYARIAQLGPVLFVDKVAIWYRLHQASVMNRTRMAMEDFRPALEATYNSEIIQSNHSEYVLSKYRLQREIELALYIVQRSSSFSQVLSAIFDLLRSENFTKNGGLKDKRFWRIFLSAGKTFWRLL